MGVVCRWSKQGGLFGRCCCLVVNWNNAGETLESVSSLRDFQSRDIFVVDNELEKGDLAILSNGLGNEILIE